jgi:hypothetical protein
MTSIIILRHVIAATYGEFYPYRLPGLRRLVCLLFALCRFVTAAPVTKFTYPLPRTPVIISSDNYTIIDVPDRIVYARCFL